MVASCDGVGTVYVAGWSLQTLRRKTMAGLLLVAAIILFAAPADAHARGEGHHGHAAIGFGSSYDTHPDSRAPLPAAVTFVSADDGQNEPCGVPGHVPGNAGCCASSHCPTAPGGLLVAAAMMLVPMPPAMLPASSPMAEGIAAGPGNRPPTA